MAVFVNSLAANVVGGSFYSDPSYLYALVESTVLSTAILLVFLTPPSDEISLTLQSGDEKRFVVGMSDARQVVREFSSRD